MTEKVYQAEGRQEVCDLLSPRILKASDVCIEVYNDYIILPQ